MKKLLALILSLVMVLALVACGGSEDAADSDGEDVGTGDVAHSE